MNTPSKTPTGILGFDEITAGGLPCGRTTLLVGGRGSGKTIFALQFLVHGARVCGETGIFVAFEESPQRLVSNFQNLGRNLVQLQPTKLFSVDAQPVPDLIHSGNFDFGGMLAALGAQSGGYHRGATVLITGFPGTAKTTFGGAFAQAACRRGERTLFVSFDSDSTEVVRNLASVGIRLDSHVESGLLP